MNRMVCIVPVCPMRKEPAHRSEMVSQLLFGETAEVMETEKDFVRLRTHLDGYEGWCQRTQLTAIQESGNTRWLAAEWVNTLHFNGQEMHIPLGSAIDLPGEGAGMIGPFACSYQGKKHDPSATEFNTKALVAFAAKYLNVPYLWGGRSIFGIDCSGFAQQVFRFFDVALPRDSYQQAEEGEMIGFLQEAREADLAFFDNAEGRIVHVGILLGSDRIIHASGRVRIDPIDNMGIISSDTGERTHTLRTIRRVGK